MDRLIFINPPFFFKKKRLSLSRIIYLLNDSYSDPVKHFFQNHDEIADEWSHIENTKVSIPTGLSSSVKAMAQKIVNVNILKY
jgi:hypothetical protein